MIFSSVTTPTLIINEEICRSHIQQMSEKAKVSGVLFRPHFKTHVSHDIGLWFRDVGVKAITVSSVSMAEYFALNGWEDITIAFPFNPLDLERVKNLACNTILNVLISGKKVAEFISQKIDFPINVFVEVDTGYKRSGISDKNTEEIIEVIQLLLNNNFLKVKGILSHFGNSYSHKADEVPDLWNQSISRLQSVKKSLSGFGDFIISVGDTPCCTLVKNFKGVDEVRPGNFVFYDVMQAYSGICSYKDIAVAVACPVVDLHPERSEFVIHGGAVHFSKEFVLEANGEKNYGLICTQTQNGWSLPVSEVYIKSLSQEHGIVKASNDFIRNLNIGDLVFVLPIHSCLTVQCYNSYLTLYGKTLDHM